VSSSVTPLATPSLQETATALNRSGLVLVPGNDTQTDAPEATTTSSVEMATSTQPDVEATPLSVSYFCE